MLGKTGCGITELYNLRGQVDILTGTLGSFGAVGGFTTGRKEIIDMPRQRSRLYLFSNSPSPVVGASIEMFKMLGESDAPRRQAREERRAFPQGYDGRRLRHQAYAVGYLRRDALRCQLSQDFAARLQDSRASS